MQDSQNFRSLWFLWVVATMVGVVVGWVFGFYISEWSVPLAIFISSIPVWMMRWLVLHRLRVTHIWWSLNMLVFVLGEVSGYISSSPFLDNEATWSWIVATSGLGMGAMFWFTFWAMRVRKNSSLLGTLRSVLLGFAGFMLGNIIVSFTSAFVDEIVDLFSETSAVFGWIVAGMFFGFVIGAVTGFPLVGSVGHARFLNEQDIEDDV